MSIVGVVFRKRRCCSCHRSLIRSFAVCLMDPLSMISSCVSAPGNSKGHFHEKYNHHDGWWWRTNEGQAAAQRKGYPGKGFGK